MRQDAHLPITIQVATPDDVLAAIPMVNAAFAVETFLEGTRTDEARISELAKSGEFLVAKDKAGRVVASVYVSVEGEGGYFGMLAVEPSWQGTGIGRRMVEAAERYCRDAGCKQVDIAVLSLRTELPPFYRKLGYVETGREEFQPSRPYTRPVQCHCIMMSKTL